jgi:hypothetical protein
MHHGENATKSSAGNIYILVPFKKQNTKCWQFWCKKAQSWKNEKGRKKLHFLPKQTLWDMMLY